MKLKYQFVTQKVSDGYVAVVVGAQTKAFSGLVRMNESASFLFSLLDQNRTERELVDAALERYDLTEEDACAFVRKFLEHLRSEELLED